MPPFFDTNILVYSVDADEAAKFGLAGELVEEHLVRGNGAISVQVLREFYSASRRLGGPLPEQQAREMVDYFATFRTLSEDVGMVLGAARRTGEMSISFWDALIVEAALKSGADRLFTEDLQHGQVIEGMRVENPFL
jgi:predicted nucleic acid-binding protein